MVRVAINGFGRIGRLVLKCGFDSKTIEFVAVNDLTDAQTLAHLFKYDSTFGVDHRNVTVKDSKIVINGKEILALCEKDPLKLPWKDLEIDTVVESTGKFTDVEKAKLHLQAGAKRVVITAPAKGDCPTICMGVNESMYDPSKHFIVSNASCTTNCLAPMVKILHENFKVKRGLMTTIHSYTNDQVTLDFPHKDLRRARAACLSIIPTTTGAAKAIGQVIPELKGKLNGIALRVPTPNVSLVDLVVEVEKSTTIEEVNQTFKRYAEGEMAKYIEYCDLPLVSRDFYMNPKSCIFDATGTDVIDGTFIKVFGWYDNEWGYSCRVIDLLEYMAEKI